MTLQAFFQAARSPFFLVPATALLMLVLISEMLRPQHHKLMEERTGHYGNALATLGAKQATDATLNHDLISLQVTLRDIADNPHVLITTIHDVENHLLVQAGQSPNTGDYNHNNSVKFTAPITLHDSVAGYVTVTLDAHAIYSEQNDTWVLGLMAVMATLAALGLLNPYKPLSPDSSSTSAQEQQDNASSQVSNTQVNVTLELQCLNTGTLQEQLSGTMRQQLLDDLERRISAINTLYNGRIATAHTHGVTLSFNDNDIANGCFRAICTSQLLFRLLAQSKQPIKLQYSAAIFTLEPSTRLAEQMKQTKFIEQCRQQLMHSVPTTLLIDDQSCASSPLLQRLQTTKESSWHRVDALQPSYAHLIDKQTAQLEQLLK